MKQGEIDYLTNIGEAGVQSAFDKPFTGSTSAHLFDLGLIMALLPQPPARLLDLGCGTGWTSVFFARRGYQVVGQDIAPDMIRFAERNRERYGASNLKFVVTDYEALNFSEPFDCAVFYDALHHAVDERAALASVFRALRPGGMLITHEPGVGHSKSAEAIHAMEAYGVTEKDMPPFHIKKICREIGFSGFEFVPEPGRVIRATYGIDMTTLQRVRHSWLRRAIKTAGILRDRRLKRAGVCIITK
jgi:ubiquinone/menaquinone biosynthesis C-methylase UbiE